MGRRAFERYIGIDYSGAETPTAGLTGLRVYRADRDTAPAEVSPPGAKNKGAKKHWTRRGIAEWLCAILSEDRPTLVGIDHGFSFPLRYFQEHRIPLDWRVFLDDFQHHWPTGEDHIYVDFVRDGFCGKAGARCGSSRWRRMAEIRAGGAKSVFHFDVPGSVAKSTHAGLPWLRFLDRAMKGRVHFWPFDGWESASGTSVVAEVYPALWKDRFAPENRNSHQHDAYAIAAWMRATDADGTLSACLEPPLGEAEREAARVEGWILGVM